MAHNYTDCYYTYCCAFSQQGEDWPREEKHFEMDATADEFMRGTHDVPPEWWSLPAKVARAKKLRTASNAAAREEKRVLKELADFEKDKRAIARASNMLEPVP